MQTPETPAEENSLLLSSSSFLAHLWCVSHCCFQGYDGSLVLWSWSAGEVLALLCSAWLVVLFLLYQDLIALQWRMCSWWELRCLELSVVIAGGPSEVTEAMCESRTSMWWISSPWGIVAVHSLLPCCKQMSHDKYAEPGFQCVPAKRSAFGVGCVVFVLQVCEA